jgi:hypothetical protein
MNDPKHIDAQSDHEQLVEMQQQSTDDLMEIETSELEKVSGGSDGSAAGIA